MLSYAFKTSHTPHVPGPLRNIPYWKDIVEDCKICLTDMQILWSKWVCEDVGNKHTVKKSGGKWYPKITLWTWNNKNITSTYLENLSYFHFLSTHPTFSPSLSLCYQYAYQYVGHKIRDIKEETLQFFVIALNMKLEEFWGGKDKTVMWVTHTVLQMRKLNITSNTRVPENFMQIQGWTHLMIRRCPL